MEQFNNFIVGKIIENSIFKDQPQFIFIQQVIINIKSIEHFRQKKKPGAKAFSVLIAKL